MHVLADRSLQPCADLLGLFEPPHAVVMAHDLPRDDRRRDVARRATFPLPAQLQRHRVLGYPQQCSQPLLLESRALGADLKRFIVHSERRYWRFSGFASNHRHVDFLLATLLKAA
jgi:hypothetical protein